MLDTKKNGQLLANNKTCIERCSKMSRSAIRNDAQLLLFPHSCFFSSSSPILQSFLYLTQMGAHQIRHGAADGHRRSGPRLSGCHQPCHEDLKKDTGGELASGALVVLHSGEDSQSELRLVLLQRASRVNRSLCAASNSHADWPAGRWPPYSAHLNSAPTATLLGDSGVPQGTTSTWIRPRYCACFSTLHPEFSGSDQSCITGRSRVLVGVLQ